jgi:glyoxylase-like metal-dependent hydrolase (beta-lactamase superfamily II)
MRNLLLGTLPLSSFALFTAPLTFGGHLQAQEAITATVLFDNFWTDDRLQTGWGYALLLETAEHTVLFDTGGDGGVLLENMRLLGKDPMAIDAVVISHAHGDHTGGLEALLDLGIEPRLYLLESFPEEMTSFSPREGRRSSLEFAAPDRWTGPSLSRASCWTPATDPYSSPGAPTRGSWR